MTEDLDNRRDAVHRYLDQAGFRVVAGAELSRDDPEVYRVAVDADLAKSVVFVQLLSETPGRRFKGSELSYVAFQHQRAVAARKPVLQWRSRQLDAGSEEIPEDHRQRLCGPTVAATDLSEFKSLVVETVKNLTALPPPDRDPAALGGTDKLVFVDAEETDLEAARTIVGFFKRTGSGLRCRSGARRPRKCASR